MRERGIPGREPDASTLSWLATLLSREMPLMVHMVHGTGDLNDPQLGVKQQQQQDAQTHARPGFRRTSATSQGSIGTILFCTRSSRVRG
eukprot:4419683-Amphidinium_carterae.1